MKVKVKYRGIDHCFKNVKTVYSVDNTHVLVYNSAEIAEMSFNKMTINKRKGLGAVRINPESIAFDNKITIVSKALMTFVDIKSKRKAVIPRRTLGFFACDMDFSDVMSMNTNSKGLKMLSTLGFCMKDVVIEGVLTYVFREAVNLVISTSEIDGDSFQRTLN